MSYPIHKTDGTLLTTIQDSDKDTTSTNLTLPGPNYVGYGKELDENLVRLLENFAGGESPKFGQNLQGQLWFNTTSQTLNVFTDQGYLPASGTIRASSPPAQARDSNIWYNTNTEQAYLKDSGVFKLIGPIYTASQGPSGALPVQISDTNGQSNTHNIVKLQYGNVTIATISADSAFLPNPPINGFTYINPGITLSNNILNPVLNSNLIGNVTGNLTGNLTGDVTGNVIATTLRGTLNGDTYSTYSHAINFSTGNAQITSGNIAGIVNLTTTTLATVNFSTANVQITGGRIANISLLTTPLGNIGRINSSVGNILAITSTTGSVQTLYAGNISSSNVLIGGGSITSLTSAVITQTTVDNSTTVLAQVTNFSTANAQITGGNISGIVGTNDTFTSANLVNSTATTKTYNDSSTAIATTAFVQSVLPAGVILMWSGSSSTIPTGWKLCDGNNGTPNLIDRFIVGAGSIYPVGNVGGTNTNTISNVAPHTHSFSVVGTSSLAGGHSHTATSSSTVNDPGHAHSIGYGQIGGWQGPWQILNYDNAYKPTTTSTTGISVSTSTSISTVGDHSHSVSVNGTTSSTGLVQTLDNRPLYYALCYIMKTY